jgi:hypothetical protein
VILAGAGISIDAPSNVPAAAPLLEVLRDWICAGDQELRRRMDAVLAPPHARHPYEGPYASTRFELLLEWARFVEPGIYDALSLLDEAGTPNLWHHHLALAVREGAVVLTTNFDSRIERACLDLGVPLRGVVISGTAVPDAELREANLVKLHGSFRPLPGSRRRCTPVGTLSQISRFGLGFERLGGLVGHLSTLLGGRALVVCGYSGWDSFDVVPLLESVLRSTPLFWHTWSPDGPGALAHPRALDPLTDESTRRTPAEIFLSQAHTCSPGVVWEARGSTPWFFGTLWPQDLAAEAARALAGRADDGRRRPDALKALRKALSRRAFRLDPVAADALIGQLETPYNVDDFRQPMELGTGEDGEAEGSVGESNEWDAVVARDWHAGRYLDVAAGFERRVAELEDATEDPARLAYADALLLALSSAFWAALKKRALGDARAIQRKVRSHSRRRGVLWGLVLADYMEANLLFPSAAPGGSRRGRGGRDTRDAARRLLDRVIRYALRIPRLDIFVDGLRLRRHLETDAAEQLRLERAMLLWADRLPPCSERLLAVFDCLLHHVKRGTPRRPDGLLQRLETLFQSGLAVEPAMVAATRAFAALYTPGPEPLARALDELRDLPPGAGEGWSGEVSRLEHILAEWQQGRPPFAATVQPC